MGVIFALGFSLFFAVIAGVLFIAGILFWKRYRAAAVICHALGGILSVPLAIMAVIFISGIFESIHDAREFKRNYGELHYAIMRSDLERAMRLVEDGADIERRDKDGNTALLHSCARKNAELAELLLAKGADIGARNNEGNTVLHEMADGWCSDAGLMRKFLELGLDANARNKRGETVLHKMAVSRCDISLMRDVLELGADINAQDDDGDTPLMVAVNSYGFPYFRMEQVELLLEFGARLDISNNKGQDVFAIFESRTEEWKKFYKEDYEGSRIRAMGIEVRNRLDELRAQNSPHSAGS